MEKLSLIIPCYNEEEGINNLDENLKPVIKELEGKYELELIFVDDGSKDQTNKLLWDHFGSLDYVKIIKHPINKNLGAALRTGFYHSTGDIVVTLDSDCTYSPSEIHSLIKGLGDSDIVTASPYHPLGKVDGVPGYRLLLSKSICIIYRLLTGSKINTFTSIFRAHKKEVIENVDFKSDNFLATAEMLINSLKKGYKVNEYPTTLHVRQYGSSSMKLLKVIKSHAKFASNLLFLKVFKRKK